MKKEYTIEIGEVFNVNTQKREPKIKIDISEEQLYVIEMFATVQKDKNLNNIYTLNDCEFRVVPNFHAQ